MKKIFTLLFIFSFLLKVEAQDDLLNMLNQENPQKPVPVFATFKSTRVITGQSIEHISAKHLNFVILHRFGEINKGAYELWGLDQANMRLVFDYGITDRIQVGVARSSLNKTYDGNLKIKLVKQSKGKGGMPVSIGYYGNVAVNSMKWADPTRNNYFTSRMSFFNQLIIARKFGDRLSLQIAPCMVHENLVKYSSDLNTTFALGTGGSIKLNRSFRLNFEYYPRLTGKDMKSSSGSTLYDYLGLGVDIETGGHVFQIMFCNGVGMLEQQMIKNTETTWFNSKGLTNAGVRLGFNISRTFSFDHSTKKAY
ncbi:MAG: hypothetical protein CFE21_14670 [Bacteroidetes bacterium B1(2017)]|nr:MAG: hypothetical protein CFE21_14670 [Bacteroidetes bacterium B1(2017)]